MVCAAAAAEVHVLFAKSTLFPLIVILILKVAPLIRFPILSAALNTKGTQVPALNVKLLLITAERWSASSVLTVGLTVTAAVP